MDPLWPYSCRRFPHRRGSMCYFAYNLHRRQCVSARVAIPLTALRGGSTSTHGFHPWTWTFSMLGLKYCSFWGQRPAETNTLILVLVGEFHSDSAQEWGFVKKKKEVILLFFWLDIAKKNKKINLSLCSLSQQQLDLWLTKKLLSGGAEPYSRLSERSSSELKPQISLISAPRHEVLEPDFFVFKITLKPSSRCL